MARGEFEAAHPPAEAGMKISNDELQEGRLARSVWSHHGPMFAFMNLKGDVAQRMPLIMINVGRPNIDPQPGRFMSKTERDRNTRGGRYNAVPPSDPVRDSWNRVLGGPPLGWR